MDIQEVEWEGFDRIDLAEDRSRRWAVAKVVMNLPVSIKCGEFLV